MNTSAQFCKMGVDFFFEKPRQSRDNSFLCTVFIEGQAVADAMGPKKTVKHAAADNALKSLSKFCHTVVMNPNQGQMNRSSIVSREQIQGQAVQMKEEQSEPMGSGSVASNMMKMMGWTEGSGLGLGTEGITAPIEVKNESINREGLGSQAINSDNISREEAEALIRDYAGSDSIEDLVFASDLNFDERKEIRIMAKRYGLSERIHMEREQRSRRCFLVLSKKISSEAILEQLERDGSWGKYELVRPRGMTKRDAFAKYLNFQGLRREYGLPRELSESCRNNFAPPQLARAGGHSADFSFGRGGTSRGRGSDNREHFGSFQRDDNTGHRGGRGTNTGFRGSFRGHQHIKESSHMGFGSHDRGGFGGGQEFRGGNMKSGRGSGDWQRGGARGGHGGGNLSNIGRRGCYSESDGGGRNDQWQGNFGGPNHDFKYGISESSRGQNFGFGGSGEGEEYSPTGMLRMGAMRGRIMDRMRGGGGGGGLMEEERRLSSQRYLQQFKR